MPSGLSKAKASLKDLFGGKKKDRSGSTSTAGASDGAKDSQPSAEPSEKPKPSTAPQLERLNMSSSRLNQPKGSTARKSEDDDMTAAVLSAGGLGMGSAYKGQSGTETPKENIAPSRPTTAPESPSQILQKARETHKREASTPKVETKEEAKVEQEAKPSASSDIAATTTDEERREDHKLEAESDAHDTEETKAEQANGTSTNEKTSDAIGVGTSPSTATHSAEDAGATKAEARPINAEAVELESPTPAPEESTTTKPLSEETDSDNAPPAVHSDNRAHDIASRVMGQPVEVDKAETLPGVQTELAEDERPSNQEIEDIEKKEAESVAAASKGPGPASEAKVDVETAKGTGGVIKSVAGNAGAGGQSMGMSATSGPIDDMPAS